MINFRDFADRFIDTISSEKMSQYLIQKHWEKLHETRSEFGDVAEVEEMARIRTVTSFETSSPALFGLLVYTFEEEAPDLANEWRKYGDAVQKDEIVRFFKDIVDEKIYTQAEQNPNKEVIPLCFLTDKAVREDLSALGYEYNENSESFISPDGSVFIRWYLEPLQTRLNGKDPSSLNYKRIQYNRSLDVSHSSIFECEKYENYKKSLETLLKLGLAEPRLKTPTRRMQKKLSMF